MTSNKNGTLTCSAEDFYVLKDFFSAMGVQIRQTVDHGENNTVDFQAQNLYLSALSFVPADVREEIRRNAKICEWRI